MRTISDDERRARLEQSSVTDMQAALYEQRALLRILGMRRTMFVPADLVPVVQACSTLALVPGERRRFAARQRFAATLETGGVAADGRIVRGRPRAHGFDRSGAIGPTVWRAGRIVGGWAQRKADGEVVVRLLEDVGPEAERAVAEEAEREARVTPRFRMPLQRELCNASSS